MIQENEILYELNKLKSQVSILNSELNTLKYKLQNNIGI